MRSLRAPDYRKRWSERFAYYPVGRVIKADLVFHAVSVGEVHAAVPLIEKVLANTPQLSLLVTTSTPTGSARVSALFGERVEHVYLPYDYPGAVNRFLDACNPSLLVIMETEWWPNLLHYCRARNIYTLLANARLSEKSRNNYARMPGLARTMLESFDSVTAQSDQDRSRLESLGLPADKVDVVGSIKYDLALNTAQISKARSDRALLGNRPVVLAASTRTLDGVAEEDKVLAAFRQVLEKHSDVLLVLVPRHPERFDETFALSEKHAFNTVRRSTGQLPELDHQVYLGDSMGEMHYYLGLADITFVGGSLVPTGCQNIIEPAALGLPVITGPSLFNFSAVSEALIGHGGQLTVNNEQELAAELIRLLESESDREAMGKAAREVVTRNRGATDRNLAVISELLNLNATR